MQIKPQTLLIWIRRAAVGAFAFLATTLAGLWLTAYSDEHKWFQHPSQQLEAVTNFAVSILASPWLHWVGGIIIGFAVGIWLDVILRRLTAEQPPQNSLLVPEKGFLDYHIDALKTVDDVKRITDKLTARTTWLGIRIGKSTAKIERHNRVSEGTEKDIRRARDIAKMAADDTDTYCSDIIEANRKFSETANTHITAVTWLYNNRPDWRSNEIVGAIRGLRDTIATTIAQMASFASAMENIRGISADLNQSTARAAALLREYIGILRRLEEFCNGIIEAPPEGAVPQPIMKR